MKFVKESDIAIISISKKAFEPSLIQRHIVGIVRDDKTKKLPLDFGINNLTYIHSETHIEIASILVETRNAQYPLEISDCDDELAAGLIENYAVNKKN